MAFSLSECNCTIVKMTLHKQKESSEEELVMLRRSEKVIKSSLKSMLSTVIVRTLNNNSLHGRRRESHCSPKKNIVPSLHHAIDHMFNSEGCWPNRQMRLKSSYLAV